MKQIKVLIVDDHTIVREGLKWRLGQVKTIKVVGEASNGMEAQEMVKSKKPNVVLIDERMPKLSGLETLKEIKKSANAPEVIMLTSEDCDDCRLDAIRNGAKGYFHKDIKKEKLIEAIERVNSGSLNLEVQKKPFVTIHSQIVKSVMNNSIIKVA